MPRIYSMKRIYITLLTFVALTTLTAGGHAQNIVTNGDFTSTAGLLPTSWTFAGSSVGGGSSQIFNDAGSFPGGGNYFWLNGAPGEVPTLTQTLTVVPGAPYDISGNFARIVIGGTNGFMVRFRDAGTNAILSSTSFTPTTVWAPFSFSQTFGVSSVKLEVIGQANGVDADIKVDNISIVTTAPEPGTLALAALGIAGLALRRRRK
jgi:hypothetical protein